MIQTSRPSGPAAPPSPAEGVEAGDPGAIRDGAPLVSVILPVHDRAGSVAAALDSVLGQSPAPHEVIVVDDGSTDGLAAALAPYEGRIRLHRQENAGVAAARNAGVRLATGDWLAFQDSDDLWAPDHMATVVRDLSGAGAGTATGAGADVVCHLGDVTYTGAGYARSLLDIKGCRFPEGRAERVEAPFGLVMSGMTLQAAAIRATAFHRIGGFDEGMRMLSDTAFFCLLALEGPFAVTGREVAEIRRLPGDEDAITSLRRKNALYARAMHVRYLEAVPPARLAPEERRAHGAALSGALFRRAEAEAAAGQGAAARASLLAAARHHPSAARGWVKSAIALALGTRGHRMIARPDGLDRG